MFLKFSYCFWIKGGGVNIDDVLRGEEEKEEIKQEPSRF